LASKFSPQINALNESGSGVAIILRANRGYDSDGALLGQRKVSQVW